MRNSRSDGDQCSWGNHVDLPIEFHESNTVEHQNSFRHKHTSLLLRLILGDGKWRCDVDVSRKAYGGIEINETELPTE